METRNYNADLSFLGETKKRYTAVEKAHRVLDIEEQAQEKLQDFENDIMDATSAIISAGLESNVKIVRETAKRLETRLAKVFNK